jgi:hypothetical protein
MKTGKRRLKVRTPRQRFGLPNGFIPRLQRYGRMILLEENIYRLPNGDEFIPCHPTGTLGRIHHLYALLTEKQYGKNQRGSVYIRTDGRIFDYSFDQAKPDSEIFDTGYTIHDLERTGRYATRLENQRSDRSVRKKGSGKR